MEASPDVGQLRGKGEEERRHSPQKAGNQGGAAGSRGEEIEERGQQQRKELHQAGRRQEYPGEEKRSAPGSGFSVPAAEEQQTEGAHEERGAGAVQMSRPGDLQKRQGVPRIEDDPPYGESQEPQQLHQKDAQPQVDSHQERLERRYAAAYRPHCGSQLGRGGVDGHIFGMIDPAMDRPEFGGGGHGGGGRRVGVDPFEQVAAVPEVTIDIVGELRRVEQEEEAQGEDKRRAVRQVRGAVPEGRLL